MSGVRRRVGDITLWVEEQGSGSVVLCISGLGYSAWCWRDLAAALSRNHRVVTFDNRGTGRSDAPEDGYSIAQFARDAACVLEAVGAAQAHVVGHSMGGYIALSLAVQRPELVRSLVLIGTSSGGPGALPIPPATSEAWKASVSLPPAEFARATMPYSFATGWSDAHPERFEELLARRLEFPTATEPWKKQFRAVSELGRDGIDVASLSIPALVIHGTDDRVVPYINGQRLARQLPRARLHSMDGAGHLCFLEEPKRVLSLLQSWVEAHNDSPSVHQRNQ